MESVGAHVGNVGFRHRYSGIGNVQDGRMAVRR